MKTFGWILIGTGVALTVGVVGYTIVNSGSPEKKKLAIIDQIFQKYGSKDSPDYSPNFDSSREGLMRYDVDTLSKILTGELH